MNFSDALQALKEGKKVARAGWNGKSMFLFIVCGDCIQDTIFSAYGNPKYPFLLDANGNPLDEPLPVNDAIYMKTADNKLVAWLAYQTDLLAEDWEII